MPNFFRIIHRWWLEHNVRRRTELIQQYRAAISRCEGSAGEQLAEISRLRTQNMRDASKVTELLQ